MITWTVLNHEAEYEDFCDGMSTLKIDVDEQTGDHIEVKTEQLEDDLEFQNSAVIKKHNNNKYIFKIRH